ncbi:surfactant protein C-like isoform 2-T2 [Discoglossus pictus]
MEQKSTENLTIEPPSYSFPNKMTESKKKWTLVAVVIIVLTAIIVTGAIVGAHLNQQHIEKVVSMAFQSNNGEQVQQTVAVNGQESVAAVFVKINNESSTVLYDYKRSIIGFREEGLAKCYVMKMDESYTPTFEDITSAIEYCQTNGSPFGNDIAYSFTEEGKADPTQMGISMNLLCHDIPIYWVGMGDEKAITIKLKVFGFPVTVTIG